MAKALNTEENSGLTRGDVIRMDAKRSLRFNRELLVLADAIESLAAAVPLFINIATSPGGMDPRSTVTAFIALMDKQMGVLLSMINAEEHLNDDQREAADE
jgi:hypothetical protein